MILLLLVNVVLVYQYYIKSTVSDYITKESELLKVKWLACLFCSFVSPMFVFFFNTQPNYVILRFHYSWVVVLMIVIATISMLTMSLITRSNKVDNGLSISKHKEPMIIVGAAIAVASLILNLRDSWVH